MTLPAALWLALVAVEVAAVVLAGVVQISQRARPFEPLTRKPLQIVRLGVVQIWRAVRAAEPGGALLALLAFALVDELAVEALHVLVFEGAPRPFAGWVRAAYHVETAIVTAWPALLAATCWRAVGAGNVTASAKCHGTPGMSRSGGSSFSTSNEAAKQEAGDHEKRRGLFQSHASQRDRSRSSNRRRVPDLLSASWIGLVIGLAALYPVDPPGSGAPRTRAVLHTWEVLCVGGAWWGVWRGRARRWGRVEEALVIVAACETMVALVGPWASDPFTRWWIGRCFYLAAWSALVGVLARAARRV